MNELAIFAAVSAAPLMIGILLRVHALAVFVAFAAGVLLQHAVRDSVVLALAGFMQSAPVERIADVGLITAPMLLTMVVLRKSMKSSQLLLQVVPLAATAIAFGVIVLVLLPDEFQRAVYASPAGSTLRQGSDLAVAVAAILNLMLAWRLLRKRDEHHAGLGKHHK